MFHIPIISLQYTNRGQPESLLVSQKRHSHELPLRQLYRHNRERKRREEDAGGVRGGSPVTSENYVVGHTEAVHWHKVISFVVGLWGHIFMSFAAVLSISPPQQTLIFLQVYRRSDNHRCSDHQYSKIKLDKKALIWSCGCRVRQVWYITSPDRQRATGAGRPSSLPPFLRSLDLDSAVFGH